MDNIITTYNNGKRKSIVEYNGFQYTVIMMENEKIKKIEKALNVDIAENIAEDYVNEERGPGVLLKG